MALSYLSAENKDQWPYCVSPLTDHKIKVNKWADVRGSVGGRMESIVAEKKGPARNGRCTHLIPHNTSTPSDLLHNSHSLFPPLTSTSCVPSFGPGRIAACCHALVTSWSEQAGLPHTDSSNYRNQQLGPIITSCSLCPRGPVVQLTRKLSGCLALHNIIWNDRVWHQGLLTLPATGPMCGNNLHCQIAPRLPLAEEARMSSHQTLAPPKWEWLAAESQYRNLTTLADGEMHLS